MNADRAAELEDAVKSLTPYQRIVRNAQKGIGVWLSPDETSAMSTDEAIREVARNDDEDDELRRKKDA